VASVEDWVGLRAEVEDLIAHAAQEGMTLRALGSVGVHLHCYSASDEMLIRGRIPKDIDLVCPGRDRRQIREFFAKRGYQPDQDVLVAMEGRRFVFRHPEKGIDVDLWVDELEFCHTVNVVGRLGSGPTVALEDLILSKLQIVELTESDQQDLLVLFSTHDVEDRERDCDAIDMSYIAGVLSRDWGFWRTATANLARTRGKADPPAAARLDALIKAIADADKSLKWRLRARVGERVRWWQEVDIPRRTY
jgi:hypothetical protein